MSEPEDTFIVTGCNRGLGMALASHFLASPRAVSYGGLFGVRNPSKAPEIQGLVMKAPKPQHHEVVEIDLSTMASTRAAAKRIIDRIQAGSLPPIRALVLNAAMQNVTSQTFTNDGIEFSFGVNYLANFLFTLLLLPHMDKVNGRIIIVASWTHDVQHPLNGFIKKESHKTIINNIDDLAKPKHPDQEGDEYNSGMRRYGMSKLLIIMFMSASVVSWLMALADHMGRYELQRRLSTSPDMSNVTLVAVDPGAIPGTGLLRDSSLLLRIVVHWMMGPVTPILCWMSPNGYFRTAAKSAVDLFNASFDQNKGGKYPKGLYLNGSDIAQSSPETKDQEKQKRLWKFSIELTGLKQRETAVDIN